jgi:hypothetical protein
MPTLANGEFPWPTCCLVEPPAPNDASGGPPGVSRVRRIADVPFAFGRAAVKLTQSPV